MFPFSRKPQTTRGGTSPSVNACVVDSSLLRQRSQGLQVSEKPAVEKEKKIDAAGVLLDPLVQRAISPAIERGPMTKVNGIIVHQTGGSTSAGTLSQYTKKDSNGAHFLIDKDGTIYQTASVYKKTYHVGKLKSRCLAQHKCTDAEYKKVQALKITPLSDYELKKSWPDRFPSNADAIGVELVGKFIEKDEIYESVTEEQNASLKWLIRELTVALGIPMTEIFRHPDVSYKKPSEASSAKWTD
jgi:N-acetyl-anhydromuramyl-L-alanine amidase AmpD